MVPCRCLRSARVFLQKVFKSMAYAVYLIYNYILWGPFGQGLNIWRYRQVTDLTVYGRRVRLDCFQI